MTDYVTFKIPRTASQKLKILAANNRVTMIKLLESMIADKAKADSEIIISGSEPSIQGGQNEVN